MDKRHVMLRTEATLTVIGLTIGLLHWTRLLSLPVLFALGALSSVVIALQQPTRNVLVVLLVGEDRMPAANALMTLLVNVLGVIGPAVASLLIA